MNFKLDDSNLVINHLFLNQSQEILEKIRETRSKDVIDEPFKLTIMINGVEIEHVDSYENFMKYQYEVMENRLKQEYNVDAFDMRVRDAAEKIIKDKFGDLMDKMYDFERSVDFGNSVIETEWGM
ncbi:conserved hypothetical protein [Aeromonas phage 65]|uniref:Uncharacterized protein n=2 Tax=Ishigurovirus osborne TaxID=260149 RepID=A0A219YC08_9CAUD|nr:hypothetical protein ST65p150 [Aeromonas phage 65]ADQ53158.1 conserved hypothetical protein [Aeromonas phage 65]APU01536.1 hypothetical protein [Aeromonas phage 65.2]